MNLDMKDKLGIAVTIFLGFLLVWNLSGCASPRYVRKVDAFYNDKTRQLTVIIPCFERTSKGCWEFYEDRILEERKK